LSLLRWLVVVSSNLFNNPIENIATWLSSLVLSYSCNTRKVLFYFDNRTVVCNNFGCHNIILERCVAIRIRWSLGNRCLINWGILHTINSRFGGQYCIPFSLFRGPFDSSQVCPDLSACLCSFFLQSFVNRKVPCIGWNTVCLRQEYDRLGVRQLREFNLTLLGKWCWRLLVDREGF